MVANWQLTNPQGQALHCEQEAGENEPGQCKLIEVGHPCNQTGYYLFDYVFVLLCFVNSQMVLVPGWQNCVLLFAFFKTTICKLRA